MSHHHEHDHHDHDDHDHHHTPSELSFEEKMVRLLEHWMAHNDDHARNYREWAEKARESGLPDVAPLLEQAANMTESISNTFDDAVTIIKSGPVVV